MTLSRTFSVVMHDSAGTTGYDDALSFQSADNSGSFSIWPGHVEFIALGVAGISTLRRRETTLYLAAPQLLIEFSRNRLYLSSRRLFVDSNRDTLGGQLQSWLQQQQDRRQQQAAQAVQFERELVRRLLEASRDRSPWGQSPWR